MALSSLMAAVDGNAPCCHFVASGITSATSSEIASCNRLALSSSMAAVNGCGELSATVSATMLVSTSERLGRRHMCRQWHWGFTGNGVGAVGNAVGADVGADVGAAVAFQSRLPVV